jgi:hypothetical protein
VSLLFSIGALAIAAAALWLWLGALADRRHDLYEMPSHTGDPVRRPSLYDHETSVDVLVLAGMASTQDEIRALPETRWDEGQSPA